MGLIPDSSVLIAEERAGHNARQALSAIAVRVSGEDVAVSVVTVIELMHGAIRADSPERESMRRNFLNELLIAVPIHPVTVSVALRLGRSTARDLLRGSVWR